VDQRYDLFESTIVDVYGHLFKFVFSEQRTKPVDDLPGAPVVGNDIIEYITNLVKVCSCPLAMNRRAAWALLKIAVRG
jgi:hypothetical protein